MAASRMLPGTLIRPGVAFVIWQLARATLQIPPALPSRQAAEGPPGSRAFAALLVHEIQFADFWLIFYSLGMPSARKLLISLRAVVEYFEM